MLIRNQQGVFDFVAKLNKPDEKIHNLDSSLKNLFIIINFPHGCHDENVVSQISMSHANSLQPH